MANDNMGKEPKYRVFKISINLLFFHLYSDSKVYKIKGWWNLIIPVFMYSMVTILLGFFGLKIFKSLEALHINFTGGEDYTMPVIEGEFDDSVNYIRRNLTRATSQKLDRRGIEKLLEIQEKYMESNDDVFSDNNIYSLKSEIARKWYNHIQDNDIVDFFDALKILSLREK